MPATGVFYIPALPSATSADSLSTSQLLLSSLLVHHPHLAPLPAWSLDYRLFRETPSLGDSDTKLPTPAPAALLQILTLAHYEGVGYAAVTRPKERATNGTTESILNGSTNGVSNGASKGAAPSSDVALLTLPSGPGGADELAMLLAARFAPLWSRRPALNVSNQSAQAFRIAVQAPADTPPTTGEQPARVPSGEFEIRFGEVREVRAGGGPLLRGTVAEVRYRAQESGAGEGGDAREPEDEVEAVKRFWAELEVPMAKAFVGTHVRGDRDGVVRLWLEALRPRI